MRQPGQTSRRFRLTFVLTALAVAIMGCGSQTEIAAPPAIDGETRTFTFASSDEGGVPSGWKIEQTGKGDGSTWRVVGDESSPSQAGYVLAQTAKSPRLMFNLCVVEDASYGDVRLTVAFKAVAGEGDQGGGLVWRYVDANNYYICRFNPLENNLRVYEVIAGKRKQLASTDVEAAAGAWHTLTATMTGDLMVCTLGDAQVAARDDSLRDAGRIGLWTKADAQTRFDQLRVTASNAASSEVAVSEDSAKQTAGAQTRNGGTDGNSAPAHKALGIIEGSVRLVGDEIPASTKVSVSAEVDFCGANHSLEDYVIDPTSRGIRYVIVRLSGDSLKKWPPPKRGHFVLNNENCRFEPHAAVMTVGSTIECVNSDPIFHTTHAYFGENFNFALPQKGNSVTHTMRVTWK